MFQLINLYKFLKFVEMGTIYSLAFWYLWVHDGLMSLHPRFIE